MIDQVLPLAAVIVLIAVAAVWIRRREGAAVSTTATFAADHLRELGVRAGTTALVLFTAPGCAPCVPAKRVLDDVARRHDVPLVVADVSTHSDVATAQHVYRAPTTFVVDGQGRALARISGVPRPEELEAVLGGTARAAA